MDGFINFKMIDNGKIIIKNMIPKMIVASKDIIFLTICFQLFQIFFI